MIIGCLLSVPLPIAGLSLPFLLPYYLHQKYQILSAATALRCQTVICKRQSAVDAAFSAVRLH